MMQTASAVSQGEATLNRSESPSGSPSSSSMASPSSSTLASPIAIKLNQKSNPQMLSSSNSAPTSSRTSLSSSPESWTESAEKIVFSNFEGRASGHSKIFTIKNNRLLLKPQNPNEKRVYKELQNSPLKNYVPSYHGTFHCSDDMDYEVRYFQTKGNFIVLGNCTAPYKHPSVMDVKIGQRGYVGDDINKMKRRIVKSSATTAKSVGFRVAGIRIYQPSTNSYVVRKKVSRDRLISEQDGSLAKTLSLFLYDGVRFRLELIPSVIEKLQGLHDALEADPRFVFVASSILFCYEGDYKMKDEEKSKSIPNDHYLTEYLRKLHSKNSKEDTLSKSPSKKFVICSKKRTTDSNSNESSESTSEESEKSKVNIYLIDFDHAIIKDVPDDTDISGVKYGILQLISHFRKLYMFAQHRSQREGLVLRLPESKMRRNSTPAKKSKLLETASESETPLALKSRYSKV